MDSHRFDALARAAAKSSSRRRVLSQALAAGLGLSSAAIFSRKADAAKLRKSGETCRKDSECEGYCSIASDGRRRCSCPGGTTVDGYAWYICNQGADSAWISSSAEGGIYDPAAICQSLGYSGYGRYGGNCGSVCGHCDYSTCRIHGSQEFDGQGADTCGAGTLCSTVTWECINVI